MPKEKTEKVYQRKCAVPYCATVGTKGFSKFPSDPNEFQIWLNQIGLRPADVKPRALVCHSHFKDSCFASDGGVLRRLRKNSKPEINLPVILEEHSFQANPELDHVFTYNGVEVDPMIVENETDFVL